MVLPSLTNIFLKDKTLVRA